MTNDRSNRHVGSANAHRKRSTRPQAEHNLEQQIIMVGRSGDWLPAEELREAAIAALSQGKNVTLNLDRVDHLDASALQILLALHAALKMRGQNLLLLKASPRLRKWFEFSGVDGRFFHE
jgi:anti-anti-sigma factor